MAWANKRLVRKSPLLTAPLDCKRTKKQGSGCSWESTEDGGFAMLGVRTGALQGLRRGIFILAIVSTWVALSSDDAEARRRRAAASYSPAYSAIVVDANSGAVLHASNPDALRHPASLTKIMTLYMLFERLESGKLKLDTPLKV